MKTNNACGLRKKSVSITLEAEILEKLNKLARKDNRSLSQYINAVVRDYIARKGGVK